MRGHWSVLGAALATLALAAAGCNGPKGDCEGTLDSFAGCINSNDWDCMDELMSPIQRKKFGDRTVKAWAAQMYTGAKHFRWTKMQAVPRGELCLARTLSSYTVKIRGHKPEDFDDQYDSYTLHRIDGKWYLDIPGADKLQGY